MAANSEVLVNIPQGTLRGQKESSPFGDVFYSFQGIPYAKPPIGDLRFKSPQPAEGWTGIRDATKSRGVCPHVDIFLTAGQLAKGSDEDCLFVHVFTKKLPTSGYKYPVLVNFHGGGYAFGTGNKEAQSPDYFMSHNIVYVSVNYRLGPLGFLSLQTPDCPGNYGLKDQRLALKWVQDNISYFGGDPNNVTIFGISAGGSSVHNHTISPSSAGLFHRAIAQSGASTNPWGWSRHPRESAYLLGKRLGCNAKSDEELLSFLRKAPVEEIAAKSLRIWTEIEGDRIGESILNFSFCPTLEPENEDAFLTNVSVLGEYQCDVPYITGATEKELIMEVYNSKQLPKWKEDKDYQEIIPRELDLEPNSELSLKVAKELKRFYFRDGMNVENMINVLSDIIFVHGVHRVVKNRLNNKNLKSPIYLYKFSFDGKCNYVKEQLKTAFKAEFEVEGACHGDDTGYLFINEQMKLPMEKGSPEYETMSRLVKLWVDFATTGKPTNDNSEIQWPPTEPEKYQYLNIGDKLKLENGFFKERMEFWDNIYKLAGIRL